MLNVECLWFYIDIIIKS